jgi:hypothetical protein
MGHTMDVQHKFVALSQHVAMLEQQRHITPAAAPGLNQAFANLSKALASAPPPTTQTAGSQPPARPAEPPGYGHGNGHGDAKHGSPNGH